MVNWERWSAITLFNKFVSTAGTRYTKGDERTITVKDGQLLRLDSQHRTR
jgi:hypothetical protein